jgi:outer membrane protein assembly factor BamB
MKFLQISLSFFSTLLVLSCAQQPNNNNWNVMLPDVTSSSSPNLIDLNNDNILDVVIGAGAIEWEKSETGIVAINGANGAILWTASARNQIVGSAVFQDITGDGTPDVFIGGRSAELQAIDGKTGAKIWEFYTKKGRFASSSEGWFNFFNAQWVPDQDQDGLKDLLICNGGDAMMSPSITNRPVGRLLVIGSKTGKILSEGQMPDNRETYFSPIIYENSQNPTVIFGSGGESIRGHLYRCTLSDLRNKNLKNATIIDSTAHKGYIAPPIVLDFNHDKVKDILFNTSEGQTKLIDGRTLKPLWQVRCDSAEVYSQPAVGRFTGNDTILDVFVNYAIGEYPTYKRVEQWLIDGKTGKVVQKFQTPNFTYSSPLTADLNQDGTDEVIMNTVSDTLINNKKTPYYHLNVFDFKNHHTYTLTNHHAGACFASTPWIGDIDGDSKLDVIYSGSPAIVSEFPGTTTFQKPVLQLNIHRRKLPQYTAKSVKWGSYMGNL